MGNMARMSASQFRSKMNQAVNKYNNEVRRHNNQVKSALNKYNQEVRRYNAQVRSNRQKLQSALNNLRSGSYSRSVITVTTGVDLYQSSLGLETSYETLENSFDPSSGNKRLLLDLPGQEAENSSNLYSSLVGENESKLQEPSFLQKTHVEILLANHDEDLAKRWIGALFSLNPSNPDATRHFCTSVREIYDRLIEKYASDEVVFRSIPNCVQHNNKPARKEKLKYIMLYRGMQNPNYSAFVEKDITDILDLFRNLNEGTHGHVGKLDIGQLMLLKKRVEDSIQFLTSILSSRTLI